MIKSRLLILAERLERIAKRLERNQKTARQFNLGTWISKYCTDHDTCHTAACAVGEATFIPKLRKLGLTRAKGGFSPKFRQFTSWTATEKFFGLTTLQAEQLFMPGAYTSGRSGTGPAEVAARIRKAVATGDSWQG